MDILSIPKMYRGGKRLGDILQTVTRHGFGHVVQQMNLQAYLPFGARLKKAREARPPRETLGQRLVLLFEALGPTFVKLGQVLSSRPDILPEDLVNEFRRLQDHVEPFASDEAVRTVEAELGQPVGETFQSFETRPLASGSIAQVHAACLNDGTEVIVKVRRPGIETIVGRDIEILLWLTPLLERFFPEISVMRPMVMVEEFARTIRKEMDFLTEAASITKFATQFADHDGVRIPTVYWELSTSGVLTLERVRGLNVGDLAALEQRGVDRKKLARTITTAFLYQFLDTGRFHADPHPGNLLVDEEGRLGIVDFGQTGYLTPDMKANLALGLIGLVKNDLDLLLDVYGDMGVIPDDADPAEMKPQIADLVEKYYGIPVGMIDARAVFADVLNFAQQFRLYLPREFVLLGKACVAVSSVAKLLDPDFDFAEVAAPHAKRLIHERVSPLNIAKSAGLKAFRFSHMAGKLPGEIRQVIRKAARGGLQVQFMHRGLEGFTSEFDRGLNRLAASLIVAAIVVASSTVTAANVLPITVPVFEKDVSVLGLAGYVLALIVGIPLVLGILRSGRL